MGLRDIDLKETLTTRPTTLWGALLLLAVIVFFIDDVIILSLLVFLNPVIGAIVILAVIGYLWYTDRI